LVLDKHKRDAIKQPGLVHAATSGCLVVERATLSQSYPRP
jgi:hypothetical protein